MITYKPSQSTNDFEVISKPGVYQARLAVIRTTHQDEKYAKDKDGNAIEPKQLISFVWDCVNREGKNVHVHTKPCTLSYNEKSNLPKIWKNVATLTSQEDFENFFYDKAGNLKDLCADVMVQVTNKDGKIYNEVSEVIEQTIDSRVTPSALFDWDLKVYGKMCDEYDLTPSYKDQVKA